MAFNISEEGRHLLLEQVWGAPDAESAHWTWRIYPYEDLYYNLLNSSLRTPPLEQLQNFTDVTELVKLVKNSCERKCTVGAALDDIRQEGFSWLRSPDERALVNCLEVAFRLWLFTKPSIKSHDVSLIDAAIGNLPSRPIPSQIPATGSILLPDTGHRLSEDFSARNLERKGGFQINWTSQLEDHLTCPDKRSILVFRHARTLQDYQKRQPESNIYPPGLLIETDRTIGLLFPQHKSGIGRRLRKLSKKAKADVEANWLNDDMEDFARYQLSAYPIYQQRLLLIQSRYDSAKPSHPKQWWYDRRRRLEWAGLWIAIMVFVLTLITLATSVMQVYAAFHFK